MTTFQYQNKAQGVFAPISFMENRKSFSLSFLPTVPHLMNFTVTLKKQNKIRHVKLSFKFNTSVLNTFIVPCSSTITEVTFSNISGGLRFKILFFIVIFCDVFSGFLKETMFIVTICG
jgi:ABC-type microcin C transport system permease subunit YejE